MTRLARGAAVLGTFVVAVCGRTLQPPTPSSATATYDLTLDIGSGCAAVPEAERARRYTAVFIRVSPADIATLSGATFLEGPTCTAGSGRYSGIGCHQFFVSDDYGTFSFWLESNNDEAHGGHIVERTASGTWLEIIGTGRGSGFIGSRTIEATGTSFIRYCRSPLNHPFPCPAVAECSSNDMRLTFTRK